MDYQILAVIGYFLLMVLAYLISKRFKLQSIAKDAIINAKRWAKQALENGIKQSGQQQEDYAVATFYPLIPTWARVFVSEQAFRKIINFTYQKVIDYIDDGQFNQSNGKR